MVRDLFGDFRRPLFPSGQDGLRLAGFVTWFT